MQQFFFKRYQDIYKSHPLVLVDVGASGGLEPRWDRIKECLHVIGFEPDSRSYRELAENKDDRCTWVNTGLHESRTQVDFFLTRQRGCSSLYRPNMDFWKRFPEQERMEIVEQITMAVDTLDHQLALNGISRVDFIKLDTQGSELSILRGGTQALTEQIFGVELEVEFIEGYKGQPLFSDVDPFMRGQGYQLMDIERWYYKTTVGEKLGGLKGQLIWGNAIYFKAPEGFKQGLNNINDPSLKKAKLLNAVSICLLYGYADYAAEILSMSPELFTGNELPEMRTWLYRSSKLSAKIPYFRGKPRVAHLLHKMATWLGGFSKRWVYHDQELGNDL